MKRTYQEFANRTELAAFLLNQSAVEIKNFAMFNDLQICFHTNDKELLVDDIMEDEDLQEYFMVKREEEDQYCKLEKGVICHGCGDCEFDGNDPENSLLLENWQEAVCEFRDAWDEFRKVPSPTNLAYAESYKKVDAAMESFLEAHFG